MEIAAIKVPYQVFGMLRDYIRYDLKESLELEHRPHDEYLENVEETIRFIEAHDKFTSTTRTRELLERVKALPRQEVAK